MIRQGTHDYRNDLLGILARLFVGLLMICTGLIVRDKSGGDSLMDTRVLLVLRLMKFTSVDIIGPISRAHWFSWRLGQSERSHVLHRRQLEISCSRAFPDAEILACNWLVKLS